MAKEFITKDNGKREECKSGSLREVKVGKPRFDLILPTSQPYDTTLLYRWAMIMERGIKKYGDRDWEKSNSIEELNRFKASACRHFIQAMSGLEDEDHMAAVCFNLNAITYLMNKLGVNINGERI